MIAERKEFLQENPGNKGNGYRLGKSYGHGRQLEFRIPRDRFGNFHPVIYAMLKDQDEESMRLAGSLYTKGLTQGQVGDIFEEVYGRHYSKSSISRMIDYLRDDTEQWLIRPLEGYYPIVFVDGIHIKLHRNKRVENEAFYVVLGVKPDRTREVLGIYNRPVESANGWEDVFRSLQERGVENIGLLVADGLKYLENSLALVYPGTPLQKCVTHLKRRLLSKVRHGDKMEMADDLREVFRTGDTSYTPEQGWVCWCDFCDKWGQSYRSFRIMREDSTYRYYFTYLNYHHNIQGMIYTTNWIERLQRDFRRVLRMRGAMPNEESVMVLMAKTAMDKTSYCRALPKLDREKALFNDTFSVQEG
jgi:transposase-like protein